jgi:hypothetical protein
MFRFNPDSPTAWAEAVERHQRRGDGEALAAMIRGGVPMTDEARGYLAGLVASTAKRPKGRKSKALDPLTIYRDRRIQQAIAGQVERVAQRGGQERALSPGQRARGDEMVVVDHTSQERAVQAVVDAIAGTCDELQRTAVADLARRIGRDLEEDGSAAPPASPNSGDLDG